MSSVPHECPPGGRRCFDCNPRVGIEHADSADESDPRAWATLVQQDPSTDAQRSATETVVHRIAQALNLRGVEFRIANALAPEIAEAVIEATRAHGDRIGALRFFSDRLVRGTR